MHDQARRYHFQRFEIKYQMPARVVDYLIPELLKFMSPDPYAQLQPNHRYFINSLYLDSAGLDCYYQKIFGMRTRKKVRVRTYDRIPRPDTTVFLEIKKKYDAVVIKDRIAVPFRECEQILFHHITDEKSMEGNADTLRELIWLLRYNGMVPQLMVWYEREPFISTIDSGFRVTLDRNIHGGGGTWFGEQGAGYPLAPQEVILEVKFNNVLPAWFHQIIHKYHLQAAPFSKYCRAIEARASAPRTIA